MTPQYRDYFQGRNFMTPQFVSFHYSDKLAIELSTGTGMLSGNRLYGVTVKDRKTKESLHELSKCLHSAVEADNYIEQLLKGFTNGKDEQNN